MYYTTINWYPLEHWLSYSSAYNNEHQHYSFVLRSTVISKLKRSNLAINCFSAVIAAVCSKINWSSAAHWSWRSVLFRSALFRVCVIIWPAEWLHTVSPVRALLLKLRCQTTQDKRHANKAISQCSDWSHPQQPSCCYPRTEGAREGSLTLDRKWNDPAVMELQICVCVSLGCLGSCNLASCLSRQQFLGFMPYTTCILSR